MHFCLSSNLFAVVIPSVRDWAVGTSADTYVPQLVNCQQNHNCRHRWLAVWLDWLDHSSIACSWAPLQWDTHKEIQWTPFNLDPWNETTPMTPDEAKGPPFLNQDTLMGHRLEGVHFVSIIEHWSLNVCMCLLTLIHQLTHSSVTFWVTPCLYINLYDRVCNAVPGHHDAWGDALRGTPVGAVCTNKTSKTVN